MFKLKTYQQNALSTLRSFLEESRFSSPKIAYEKLAKGRTDHLRSTYIELEELENVPYCCIRIPTGGGKTHLSAHTVSIAAETYLEKEYPLVLWLVPTNIIREQAIQTLNQPDHPNRQVLDKAFDGHVLIKDISDFTTIRPQDIRDKACVIVGTIATLRVEDTKVGRKVYSHNENLEPHFSRIPESYPDLERIEEGELDEGKIKFSFRNLLTIHNPLVIVDEAHNASTTLSFEVLKRIKPSCVVEFTATPATNSNVVYNVSAAELKTEEMIKLPIILSEHKEWKTALRYSIDTRKKLHKLAERDKDFIQPIVLIQAENKNRDINVEAVYQHLIKNEKLSPEEVAIATGTQRDIDGVNLLSPDNTIRYIITVKALQEGWDCPFAYVFCSVATINSKKDVEQILGRVLRMPYAKKRTQEDLNQAYAHVSTTSWSHAVSQLHDRLVSMGFEDVEAHQFIQQKLPELEEGSGNGSLFDFAKKNIFQQELSGEVDIAKAKFDSDELKRVDVKKEGDGSIKLTITGKIDSQLENKLNKILPTKDKKAIKAEIAHYRLHNQRKPSPSEKNESFVIPQLCLWIDDELEPVEKELLLDASSWNLLEHKTELSENEFSVEEKIDSFLIDIKGRKLIERHLGTQLPLDFEGLKSEWTELQLSRWLDKRLQQPDVKQEILLEFIRKTISSLTLKRNIPLSTLVRVRFLLEKSLSQKIIELRKVAYKNGFQKSLFGNQSAVQTSYDYSFSFDPKNYPGQWFYKGSFQFPKHYYPSIAELKSSGDEFECAQAIERCSHVKCWVRNLVRKGEHSFSLPTSSQRFYPDFVALLKDGRVFVIEYKGKPYESMEETKEKQNIGELWEEKSHGKGIFLMAVKQDDDGRDVYKQIDDKISS